MTRSDLDHYSSSTWAEQRPVTVSLLILRGLMVGGWVVAEGLLLLAVAGVVFSQLGSS